MLRTTDGISLSPQPTATGVARITYYTSRANGSKAARACLRFRPKILERKSYVKYVQ